MLLSSIRVLSFVRRNTSIINSNFNPPMDGYVNKQRGKPAAAQNVSMGVDMCCYSSNCLVPTHVVSANARTPFPRLYPDMGPGDSLHFHRDYLALVRKQLLIAKGKNTSYPSALPSWCPIWNCIFGLRHHLLVCYQSTSRVGSQNQYAVEVTGHRLEPRGYIGSGRII